MADEDIGWEGIYKPNIIELESDTMHTLRQLAGPPPREGAKWLMVNLFSGEFNWYKPRAKSIQYMPVHARTGTRRSRRVT